MTLSPAASRTASPLSPSAARDARHSALAGGNWSGYLICVALLGLLLVIGMATNPDASAGAACYVFLLGMLCLMPLGLSRRLHGRYLLAFCFLLIYFMGFALQDLQAVLAGSEQAPSLRGKLFSQGEILILLSAALFLLGYGGGSSFIPAARRGLCAREWAPGAALICGVLFWLIGFTSVYFVQTQFKAIITDPYWNQVSGVISLFRLLNPLGTLIMAYLFLVRRQHAALGLFLLFCTLDFLLGLYGDTKEQAFRDPVLFLFARFMVGRRLPFGLVVTGVLLVPIPFSFFAEFREDFHANGMSRMRVMDRMGDSLLETLSSVKVMEKRYADGLNYLASRTNLKPSVELIVLKSGRVVPYQQGATIVKLIYAFIPRNFLPNKPDPTIGRDFNRAFHISSDPDTYISPSQNGELYWNFGWTGVVVGMPLLGLLLARVNLLCNLERQTNLPRLLILLMTIYLVCLRLEDGIAISYTYWIRCVLMLLLFDWLMPKVRSGPRKPANLPALGVAA